MTGGKRDIETSPDAEPTESEVAGQELAFDEDERLPWLESADYEDDDGGVDTGRILGFVIFGLLLLAVLIGGMWYFANRKPNPELAADGSTIAAPAGPYKVKPTDPGGRVAEGTGDLAPIVGEGETREGHLAESEAPRPSVGDGSGKVSDTTHDKGGVAVQVGAFSSSDTAERGWATLTRQTDKLNGISHRVVKGQADIGTVYRLQAVSGDVAGANSLCDALKADGIACQVKR